MSNQFTPGPWYARDGQIASESAIHGATIAVVYDLKHDADSSEENANARLIAAAPALYRALRIAKDMIEELHGQHYYEGEHVTSACSLCDINAALALVDQPKGD